MTCQERKHDSGDDGPGPFPQQQALVLLSVSIVIMSLNIDVVVMINGYHHLMGRGAFIKEFHGSHVGHACYDCNVYASKICIYHEKLQPESNVQGIHILHTMKVSHASMMAQSRYR